MFTFFVNSDGETVKKSLALITVLSSIFSAAAAMTPLVIGARPSQEKTQKEKQPPPKAVVKFKPQPHCPKEAREQTIGATIVLRAIFRASGEVTDLKFDKVIPADLPEEIVNALTEESMKAARQIKFDPAMKDGHPVSMYMQLEYNFRCN